VRRHAIVCPVPREKSVPPELAGGPFRAADAAGLIGRSALAGPSYRRLLRGVYQAADLTVDHGTMISAVREGGAQGVLCGPSAAWALGCRLADPGEPVHLATGDHGCGRDTSGLSRLRTTLDAAEVVPTPWGPATSPARTAVDLARGVGTSALPFPRIVAWVDALVRATPLTSGQARRAGVAAVGLHGIDRARHVLRAVRDGVDSPKETELRLLVIRLGFPEPQVQCPVTEADGLVVASLDLGWRRRRTGLEYDGAVHREALQHSKDLTRLNGIRSLEWHVIQVDNRGLRYPGAWIRQLSRLVPRR
jgi:hypothetical protein